MIKRLFFCLFAWVMCSGLSVRAQEGPLPFFRSFLDGNLNKITFTGPNEPGASGRAADGNYKRINRAVLNQWGLQLTRGKEEIGAFYLPEYIFSTQDGLLIEFEYIMMYTNAEEIGITDVICMFLVDATTNEYIGSNLKYGAEGAGFGYTHRRSGHTDIRYGVTSITGMKGGYLAVALDQGHFKNWRFENYEMRNGIPYGDAGIANVQSATYNTRSNVTIRGAAGRGEKVITTSLKTHRIAEGRWGYPVLITRHTGWDEKTGLEDPNSDGLRNKAGFMLNTQTGMYEQYVVPRIDNPFCIAGGKLFYHSDESAYRKAIIALEPNTIGGGFRITVTIQHGTEKTVVIENYTYPSSLLYTENGIPAQFIPGEYPTITYYSNPPQTELALKTPEKLAIGFMASTGQLTSYTNIIRNLRITPLYGANAEDDIYNHRRGPVIVRPLDNDVAYRLVGNQPGASKDNLDLTSFRIWTDEKHCLGDGQFEHEEKGVGKCKYNPESGEMTFFPAKDVGGEAVIWYDIKSIHSPYVAEKYRSSLAKIVINFTDDEG